MYRGTADRCGGSAHAGAVGFTGGTLHNDHGTSCGDTCEVRQLQGENASAVRLAEDALTRDTDQTVALLAGRVLVGDRAFSPHP